MSASIKRKPSSGSLTPPLPQGETAVSLVIPGEARQGLEDVLTDTLEVEERHESRVNSLGKATEYNR